MNTKNQVQEQIETHLRIISELKNELSSQASNVGDWKIIKILEAQISGKELPYDTKEIASFLKDETKLESKLTNMKKAFVCFKIKENTNGTKNSRL